MKSGWKKGMNTVVSATLGVIVGFALNSWKESARRSELETSLIISLLGEIDAFRMTGDGLSSDVEFNDQCRDLEYVRRHFPRVPLGFSVGPEKLNLLPVKAQDIISHANAEWQFVRQNDQNRPISDYQDCRELFRNSNHEGYVHITNESFCLLEILNSKISPKLRSKTKDYFRYYYPNGTRCS